jgi:hypothetical protein
MPSSPQFWKVLFSTVGSLSLSESMPSSPELEKKQSRTRPPAPSKLSSSPPPSMNRLFRMLTRRA